MLRNIPTEPPGFVGRADEPALIAHALAARRLVTLTGPGGVGKSRLALRTAHRTPPSGSDGVCWTDLWPLRDDRLLTAAVADAVDLADHSGGSPEETLTTWLADRRLLLVLDSCEHLLPAAQALVRRLLAECPGLTVLTTSRQPLGLDGEYAYQVRPLPPDSDGLALFADRAAAAGAPLLLPGDRAAARSLTRRLDGLPLALELAAAQLRHLPVGQVERELVHRLDLPSGDRATRPARHRTLRTTVGWSHELATPAERLLWARMSVLCGPVDTETVAEVCGGGAALPSGAVPGVLAALAAKSVVIREPGPDGGVRHRMLDTVREYGAMWLAELGETHTLAERHARHFLGRVRRIRREWFGPDQLDGYRTVERSYADLCAALDHLLGTRPHQALELAAGLGFHWACCGHLHDAGAHLSRALRHAPDDAPARPAALWALGVVRALQGDHEAAELLAGDCGQAAAAVGDADDRLRTAYLRGLVHLLCGRPSAARAEAERALCRPGGGLGPRMMCRLVRIFALTGLGLLDQARAEAGRLLVVCGRHGEFWTRSYLDYQLALIALLQGRPADAAGHARAMLGAKQRIGDSFGTALGLDLLAASLAAHGEGLRAARVYGAGLTYWRAVGHPQRGTPELGPVRERCERTTRELVGDELYEKTVAGAADGEPAVLLAEALEPG
ncbi:ATP-binding protein [Streptomyces lichenis]|uniref:Regulator n=1 Tax=Streptomyces lichenis TaxID=2306967 RepID=A0ABT0I8D1_9ACTN|nr:regulator [Streptomyces lichenis]MCK8677568.1 regulator [Streptomyces lichenis]